MEGREALGGLIPGANLTKWSHDSVGGVARLAGLTGWGVGIHNVCKIVQVLVVEKRNRLGRFRLIGFSNETLSSL